MIFPLAGLWQISPLTDLSTPQNDITFPAPLSQVLPRSLSEFDIANQEWHLMHDIDLDEAMLANAAVDLVMSGVTHFAEVRINGVAVFDCDGAEGEYRKQIKEYLHLGRNRFEILFLDPDDQDWLDETPQKSLDSEETRVGIWQVPYLEFIAHVRLENVTTEQVWHHGGGCEFLVHLHYSTYKAGLVSAAVKFNAMTYHLPIDVRSDHAMALFQIEAPNPDAPYSLVVNLDGQKREFSLYLDSQHCVTQQST